jgi:hypothetical protein
MRWPPPPTGGARVAAALVGVGLLLYLGYTAISVQDRLANLAGEPREVCKAGR